MRFETVFSPDALDARVVDPHDFGYRPRALVCRIGWPLLHGLFHKLQLDRCGERFFARRFGTAFNEALDAILSEIVLPAPDRGF